MSAGFPLPFFLEIRGVVVHLFGVCAVKQRNIVFFQKSKSPPPSSRILDLLDGRIGQCLKLTLVKVTLHALLGTLNIYWSIKHIILHLGVVDRDVFLCLHVHGLSYH